MGQREGGIIEGEIKGQTEGVVVNREQLSKRSSRLLKYIY